MARFSDLPGKPGETEAVLVGSRTRAIMELRNGNDISAASDGGSINVYRVSGGFRCLFQRFMLKLDDSTYKHLSSVDAWLKTWLPKMREVPRRVMSCE